MLSKRCYDFIYYWLTNNVTKPPAYLMPSNLRHHFSQRGTFWLYNAFFMGLKCHCSPFCPIHLCWQWKMVDLVVAHDGNRNWLYFWYWLPWLQRCFSTVWRCEYSWQSTTMDTSLSYVVGTWHHYYLMMQNVGVYQ